MVEKIAPAAEPWYVGGAVAERFRQDNIRRSEEAVRAVQEIIASAGMKAETAVLEGSPKRRIVEESKEWGAHLDSGWLTRAARPDAVLVGQRL